MLKKLKALRSGNYSSAAGGKRLTFCVILRQVFQPCPSWAILQKHSLFFLKYPQVRVWEASLAAPAPFKALSALDLFWNKAGELHIPATPGAARGPCRTLLPLSPPQRVGPLHPVPATSRREPAHTAPNLASESPVLLATGANREQPSSSWEGHSPLL